ncbi:glycoside hydrolase family 6 protein [Acidobacterium sp. S8]|uniref:glycoside hydrolase family 6 protein n=1 Tax=Acidobacterium sp. S8 TaxID=1641854 RepID=UPI00131BCAD0|nr:glycoside hydrolase family 6 protein [Acidobacterium sp. S8]
MPASNLHWRTLRGFVTAIALLLISIAAAHGQSKTLPPNTRFFVTEPPSGAVPQVESLLRQGKLKDALLIAAMETIPQAVWLTSGTPAEVSTTVASTLRQAAFERAIPVFTLYNIPGRDCGSYSAGGAENTADYETWIDAIAAAIGSKKAVIILEPDALADLPSDCGYDPTKVNIAQATADRFTQINYAVTTLETGPQTLVYLDAGNSHWQAVPIMAQRLVQAGIQQAQGFFTNVSNFNLNNYESTYDTWVSDCIAFGQDAEQGGWRLGNYSYCASQYYSPLGTVDPDNIATWIYTDEWYQQNMGIAVPTTHFVIDTSRNGQGPLDASIYANAPYTQPVSVVQTLTNGNWCNPPARGLGTHPTANTKVPLLDAYLWVKTPGQSDGTCDAAGGARAWDYQVYSQPGWPTNSAGQAVFDPLWGLDDPIAGAWFPQQALDLAQRANPALLP